MPRLIYPENRPITEDEAISWAADLRVTAWMNGDTDGEEWISTTQRRDGNRTIIETVITDPTFEEAQAELSDAGVATFARE